MSEFEAYLILGAIIAIVFIFIILYAIWCFISSAVKAGTIQALEYMLEKDTNPNATQSPQDFDNSFEKNLHGWFSFKK